MVGCNSHKRNQKVIAMVEDHKYLHDTIDCVDGTMRSPKQLETVIIRNRTDSSTTRPTGLGSYKCLTNFHLFDMTFLKPVTLKTVPFLLTYLFASQRKSQNTRRYYMRSTLSRSLFIILVKHCHISETT